MCDFVFILLGCYFLTQFILHPFPPPGNPSERLCRFPCRSPPHSQMHVYRCTPPCTHTHAHTHTHARLYTYTYMNGRFLLFDQTGLFMPFFPHGLLCLFFFFLLSCCVELLKLQPSLSAVFSLAFFLILYYLAAMAHIFILLELKSY